MCCCYHIALLCRMLFLCFCSFHRAGHIVTVLLLLLFFCFCSSAPSWAGLAGSKCYGWVTIKVTPVRLTFVCFLVCWLLLICLCVLSFDCYHFHSGVNVTVGWPPPGWHQPTCSCFLVSFTLFTIPNVCLFAYLFICLFVLIWVSFHFPSGARVEWRPRWHQMTDFYLTPTHVVCVLIWFVCFYICLFVCFVCFGY